MRKLSYAAPISLALLGFMCIREEPKPIVNFTITSPTTGQTIDQGDSVRIIGEITNPTDLHGYELIVTDTATGDTLFHKDVHAHGTKVNYRTGFVNTVTDHTPAEFKVIATLDHDGNTAERKVYFHMHPPE